MLQVARLAPRILGESAPLVEAFLRSKQLADGGFCDRGGESDLYYTVFGLEGLAALKAEVPLDRVEPFLRSYGDGEGLDLVHQACLARCWASFPPARRARHGAATGFWRGSKTTGRRTAGTIYNPVLHTEPSTDASWPWGPTRISALICPGPRGCSHVSHGSALPTAAIPTMWICRSA